jgi:hypothetical protein
MYCITVLYSMLNFLFNLIVFELCALCVTCSSVFVEFCMLCFVIAWCVFM